MTKYGYLPQGRSGKSADSHTDPLAPALIGICPLDEAPTANAFAPDALSHCVPPRRRNTRWSVSCSFNM